MNQLLRRCAVLILVLAFSLPAFGGDIPSPPGATGETQFPGVAGQTQTPGVAGETQFPGVTGDVQFPGVAGEIPFPGLGLLFTLLFS